MNALRAVALLRLAAGRPTAQAADKVIAGSLGGQAPLWAIYVAVHKGFFAAEGLDLELNFAQSGAAVTQQLTGGSLDVALSVGITDPIRAIEKGAPLALVRVIGNSPPYVLIGKPGLKSIADLKGKTISVGADNDITTVFFEKMMAANGLKKGDYDIMSGRRRGRALCRAEGRRRRCRDRPAAAQFPGQQGGLRHARLGRRLREGHSIHRHGGAPALGRRQPVGRQARSRRHRQERRLVRRPGPSRRSDRASGQGRRVRARRTPRPATTICTGSNFSSRPARSRARNCAIWSRWSSRPAPSPRASTSSAWPCRD